MIFSTLIYIEPVITLLIRYSNYFSNTEIEGFDSFNNDLKNNKGFG